MHDGIVPFECPELDFYFACVSDESYQTDGQDSIRLRQLGVLCLTWSRMLA
jgi:hypothetical protein